MLPSLSAGKFAQSNTTTLSKMCSIVVGGEGSGIKNTILGNVKCLGMRHFWPSGRVAQDFGTACSLQMPNFFNKV
jgi:hypothetical protein